MSDYHATILSYKLVFSQFESHLLLFAFGEPSNKTSRTVRLSIRTKIISLV